jgi:hypothetical protein
MTLHTPTGWQWDKETSKERATKTAQPPQSLERPVTPGRHSRTILAAGAGLAVVLIAIGAIKLAASRDGSQSRATASAPGEIAASAQPAVVPAPAGAPVAAPSPAPVVPPPPIAPTGAAPQAVAPSTALPVGDNKPTAEAPASTPQPAARKSHHRAHARERATAEWLTDPSGNPIAPP